MQLRLLWKPKLDLRLALKSFFFFQFYDNDIQIIIISGIPMYVYVRPKAIWIKYAILNPTWYKLISTRG